MSLVVWLIFALACSSAPAVEHDRGDILAPLFDPNDASFTPMRSPLGLVEARVRSLTAAERARAAEAASVLTRNCPYNRLSMVLPQALHLVMARRDAASLPKAALEQWTSLRGSIERHVDILVAIGATAAPHPEVGDYLHGQTALVDGASLAGLDDPLAPMRELSSCTRRLVDAYDADTEQRIEDARGIIDAALGERKALEDHLIGFRDELYTLYPLLGEHPAVTDVDHMIQILDLYIWLYC